MNIKQTLYIGLILQMLSCSPSSFNTHIMNVDEDELRESRVIDGQVMIDRPTRAAKSVIAVELLDKDKKIITYCTGVLIGPQTVLTAAHCFAEHIVPGVNSFNIIFETRTKFLKTPTRRLGFAYSTHPQYNTVFKKWVYRDGKYLDPAMHGGFEELPNDSVSKVPQGDHDLAVLVFEGKLPSGFEFVPIDNDSSADYTGKTVYFYGYGRAVDYLDEKGKFDTSEGQLRKGVGVVDSDFNSFEDRYFTSLSSKNSLCQGDSGGPQFFNEKSVLKVIGINSAVAMDEGALLVDKSIMPGNLVSCRGRAQVAKVAPYYDWIKSKEKILLNEMKESGK